MAPTKKLSTQVKSEKKFVAMNCGRISLRPASHITVQNDKSQFVTVKQQGLAYERAGENRSASVGPALDPTVPRDKEILDAFEQLLIEKPWMATDIRFKIEIVGEHAATRPWNGYDEQTADQVRETYTHMPSAARPSLEKAMKYELSRVEWDEDKEEYVSITDMDKIDVLDALYKEREKMEKVVSDDKVSLI